MCPYVVLITEIWLNWTYDPNTYTETWEYYSINYYTTLYLPCGRGGGDGENGGGKMNKTESFRNCKALNCLFDDMWKNGITNFCKLQDNFESDNKIIDLKIGTENMFDGNEIAHTTIDRTTGRITILFNPKVCVSSYHIDVPNPFYDFNNAAKNIIHESIHADFFREISNLLPEGTKLTDVSKSTFDETFREFMDFACDEEGNMSDQHKAIMEKWINKLAQDMWEFNNEIGKWEDYLYLAWGGIYTDDTENDPCLQKLIDNNKYEEYLNDYIDNIVDNELTIQKQKEINNCINK